ncbi:MAG: NIF family HAD-type phosphatase [Candidatus Dojkabacteria bacterium]|jgi:FMN phosphatase YigB (HAD superfamily)|nr:NIF family HAD-type phosphatase [Candidatus Dojkabacteria bacterium]
MSPKFTTIIFDLSEVILTGLKNVEEKLAPILRINSQKVYSQLHDISLQYLFVGAISETQYLNTLKNKYNWNISLSNLKKVIRSNFIRINGIFSLLRQLDQKSLQMAILSDHAQEWTDYCQRVFNYEKYFQKTLYSFQTKNLKSNKYAYTNALNILSVHPSNTLFIDDQKKNIDLAKDAGIEGIVFRSKRKLYSSLSSLKLI